MKIALALVLPFLLGAGVVRLCWPRRPAGRLDLALQALLAAGLGLGLSSCLFALSLFLLGPSPVAEAAVQAIAAVALVALAERRNPLRPAGLGAPLPKDAARVALGIAFLVMLGLAARQSLALAAALPQGKGDAAAIWNLHARFLARGGAQWRDYFDPRLSFSHPDYPLLLAAFIAHVWRAAGAESPAVPAGIAVFFTLASPALLALALERLRKDGLGFVAGIVLLSLPGWFVLGGWQYADVPFAFYFLATVALLALHARREEPGFLALAGLAASLAAFTKNEGVPLLAIAAVAAALPALRARAPRRALPFAAGAAIGAITLAAFKLQSPPNDLVKGQGAATLSKLFTGSRYAAILASWWSAARSYPQARVHPLFAVAAVLGGMGLGKRDRALAISAGVAAAMAAVYFFVYVTTPQDLAWHLSTSVERLFLQLTPPVLFACFLAAGRLDLAPVPPVM